MGMQIKSYSHFRVIPIPPEYESPLGVTHGVYGDWGGLLGRVEHSAVAFCYTEEIARKIADTLNEELAKTKVTK